MACCKWSVWVLARQKKETRLNYSVLGSISAASRPRRLCMSSANPIDNDVVPRAGGRASTTTDSHENCWSPQREILVSNRCHNVNRSQIWKAKFELKKNLLILFRAPFASHNPIALGCQTGVRYHRQNKLSAIFLDIYWKLSWQFLFWYFSTVSFVYFYKIIWSM